MNDVSGTIEPGQFLAIIGASGKKENNIRNLTILFIGAGKTTLLNFLSGREISKNLNKQGQIMVNGVDRSQIKGFATFSAYVQQDDILF